RPATVRVLEPEDRARARRDHRVHRAPGPAGRADRRNLCTGDLIVNPSRLLAPLVLAGFSGTALAHSGHGSASFFSGFVHPFGGVDHVLAMLAAGLYPALRRHAAASALPTAIVI